MDKVGERLRRYVEGGSACSALWSSRHLKKEDQLHAETDNFRYGAGREIDWLTNAYNVQSCSHCLKCFLCERRGLFCLFIIYMIGGYVLPTAATVQIQPNPTQQGLRRTSHCSLNGLLNLFIASCLSATGLHLYKRLSAFE